MKHFYPITQRRKERSPEGAGLGQDGPGGRRMQDVPCLRKGSPHSSPPPGHEEHGGHCIPGSSRTLVTLRPGDVPWLLSRVVSQVWNTHISWCVCVSCYCPYFKGHNLHPQHTIHTQKIPETRPGVPENFPNALPRSCFPERENGFLIQASSPPASQSPPVTQPTKGF